MREPPLRVQLLGHPIVMVPVMGMGAFILYQWSQNSNLALLGIMAIAAMGFVAKASERRMEFVRWRRAWNSMADDREPSSSRGPALGKLAIAIIVPAGFILHESGALGGLGEAAPGLMTLAVIGFLGTMIFRALKGRSRRRARPASRSDVVSICARSSMRVPSLTEAYRNLPAHCWKVLNP